MSSGTIGHWSQCSVHQTIAEVGDPGPFLVSIAHEMAQSLTITGLA